LVAILRHSLTNRRLFLMSDVEKAYETQIKNIQIKTGKNLDELGKIVKESGLTKHSEVRAMLQEKLGLGYGDANSLVHYLFDPHSGMAPPCRVEPLPTRTPTPAWRLPPS
jgi:hypothetical protein